MVLEQLAAHAAENLSHDYRRGYDTAARRTHWLALWQRRIAWAVHAGIDRSALCSGVWRSLLVDIR